METGPLVINLMPNALVILTLAFAPGLFWLWYLSKKDKLEPEPKRLIAKIFIYGAVVVFPAGLLNELLENLFGGFFVLVIGAPVVEELAKFYVVRRAIYKDPEFDEPMDGMVYAWAAALGFASVENVYYLARLVPSEVFTSMKFVSPSSEVLTLFVVRGLLTVPVHVLCSSMWGYALGWAKFSEKRRARILILYGLPLAMGMHGLFNYLQIAQPLGALGVLVFMVVAWMRMRRRIAWALAGSPHAPGIADLDLAPLPGEAIETKGKLEPESAAGHSVPPAVTPEPRKPKPFLRAIGVVVPALFILLVGGGWVAYQYWWLPRPQKAVDLRDAEQLTAQALRFKEQREFEKSETHFKRALAIREKALGAEHLDVAKSLHELALNYMAQRKYAEAEPLLRRVLAIRENRLGPDHLLIALTLDNLAFINQVRGNWGEASALSTRAREMRQRLAGRR